MPSANPILFPASLVAAFVWAGASVLVAAPASAIPAQATPENAEETQASDYDPVDAAPPSDLLLEGNGRRQAEALARFMHGLSLEEAGEFNLALDEFQKVIDINPSHWKLASRLASELVKRNETARAIDILKNTAESRPKDARPLILLANIYTRNLNKPQVALKYAESAMKLDPGSFDPYATLHEVQTALGNPEKANAALAAAAESGATDGEFWLRLGTMRAALELDPDHGNAQDPAKLKSINAIFEKAALHGGGDVNILGAVGDYYVLTHQLARAIPLYEKAVGIEPSRMDLLEKLGQSFKAARRAPDAIRIFERMIEVNPQQPGVHDQLGVLYNLEGNAEKAAEAFERSVMINPSEPEAFARAAQLLMEIKQADRAIALLDRAIKQFPEFEYDLGLALIRALSIADRHAESLAAAERILKKAEAERPELLSFEFYYICGGLAYQAKNWQRAAEFYRMAIKSDPDGAAAAYNDLGYLWLEKGTNIDEAGQLIRRALDLDPSNGAYVDSLGWYHYKKGEYKEALVHLLRAAELPSVDQDLSEAQREESRREFLSVIYDHIGDAYDKLGQSPEAVSYWRKSVGAKPDIEGVQAKIDKHVEPPPAQAAASRSPAPLPVPPASAQPPPSPEPGVEK